MRRIGRIGDLNAKLAIAEQVVFERIAVADVKVLVANAAQDHVHAGEVVSRRGKFLSVVIAHVRILLEAQQKRTRTASRICSVLHVRQTETRQTAQ